MYSADVVDAVALMRRGFSLRSISLSTGISRAHWLTGASIRSAPSARRLPTVRAQPDAARAAGRLRLPARPLPGRWLHKPASTRDKAYGAPHRARTPGQGSGECAQAMSAVRPGNKVRTSSRPAARKSSVVPGTGRACSRSTDRAASTCGKSSCNHGSAPLSRLIPAALPAGCSTRTVIAGLTGCGHASRTVTTGTSIRDICSANESADILRPCGEAWTGSGWPGVSPGRTRYPWPGARRWRGSTSSSAPDAR